MSPGHSEAFAKSVDLSGILLRQSFESPFANGGSQENVKII